VRASDVAEARRLRQHNDEKRMENTSKVLLGKYSQRSPLLYDRRKKHGTDINKEGVGTGLDSVGSLCDLMGARQIQMLMAS